MKKSSKRQKKLPLERLPLGLLEKQLPEHKIVAHLPLVFQQVIVVIMLMEI